MTPSRKIGAVVLAAGLGRRMGGPKWQLEIAGRSFLEQILQALRDAELDRIVCVVGGPVSKHVQGLFPGVMVVTNDKPNEGMLSSVKIGLSHLMDVRGALIVHVDHPLVRKSTYAGLVDKFAEDEWSVVKPVHLGRSGHPILIPQGLFAQILQSDNQASLNELIRTSNARQIQFPCDDPGILYNINTMDAFAEVRVNRAGI